MSFLIAGFVKYAVNPLIMPRNLLCKIPPKLLTSEMIESMLSSSLTTTMTPRTISEPL